MSDLQREIAALIIDAVNLEDVAADDIDPAAPLFGDALELALAISQAYGVQIKSDDQQNQQIFTSLATLANFVEAHRGG